MYYRFQFLWCFTSLDISCLQNGLSAGSKKFYLFYDPWFSVFKKKIGETVYGKWVGFRWEECVKISGMVDESMDKEQMKLPAQPWEFRSKPAWQRLIIMIGGVTVNLLLGLFHFCHDIILRGVMNIFLQKI